MYHARMGDGLDGMVDRYCRWSMDLDLDLDCGWIRRPTTHPPTTTTNDDRQTTDRQPTDNERMHDRTNERTSNEIRTTNKSSNLRSINQSIRTTVLYRLQMFPRDRKEKGQRTD